MNASERRGRTIAWCIALVLITSAAFLAGVTGSPASAVDQSKGTPGFCPTAKGVTVVVDFQKLGGTTIVRCDPTGTVGTGLDALQGAGFQAEGVQRWGLGFICRIENRPAATESIPIAGNKGYKEACIDTPPAAAYWSYWWSGNNCSWQYSQWGLKNRNFVMGGFEGWSFSLNATEATSPKPGIAPVRPGTSHTPCSTSNEPPPKTTNPGEHSSTTTRARTASTGPRVGAATSPTTRRAPTTSTPTTSKSGANSTTTTTTRAADGATRGTDATDTGDPNADARFTGGAKAANVQDTLRKQSKANPFARWVALGAVIALIGGAVYVTRRRRRLREA